MSEVTGWRRRLPAAVAVLLVACAALVLLGATAEHRGTTETVDTSRSEQAEQAGNQRHQQSYLKSQWSRLSINTDNLGLDLRRFACDYLYELSVAHDLRILLESHGNLILVRRRQDSALLRHGVEGIGQRREHDGTSECQAEGQPERSSG